MDLKIALLSILLNPVTGDYDTTLVRTFNTDQGCINAQIEYLNRNEQAMCRPLLPNGVVVPPGHYPKQILNADNSISYTYARFPDDLPPVTYIYPPRYQRQPDLVIEVR